MTIRKSSLLIAFILTLTVVIPVWAHHYEYTSQDQPLLSVQGTGAASNYPRMNYFSSWRTQSYFGGGTYAHYRWYATPTIKNSLVTPAINEWANELPPWATFQNESNKSFAYLQILDYSEDTSGGDCLNPAAIGCYHIDQWVQDSTRSANAVTKATIVLRTDNYSISSDYMKQTIRHELGHAIDLHERYVDTGTPACNGNELTIMDGGGCDGYNIEAIDKTRVNWHYENVGNWYGIHSTYKSGSNLVSKWYDYNYAEFRMEAQLQRKNADGSATVLENQNVYALTGGHESTGKWRPLASFNMQGRSNGQYRVCTRPLLGYDTSVTPNVFRYGTWVCSHGSSATWFQWTG